MSKTAIVLGGGLAGMSAANTVCENGGKVVLLDKSAFCGGNSTKATSGINGAGTKTQAAKGIKDNTELFVADTLKGGAKKPDVVQVLCGNSGDDVNWLSDKFALDLSLVARLGGHSAERTHRGKERFPGMTITYALIQMLEKIAENGDLARIVTKAKANKLVVEGGAVVGCMYLKDGGEKRENGPVIIATGGFGADFTQQSLLAKYRPDLMHLPTTNGEHCTGDGIKMGEVIGAKTIDLEWVQVHPTGLVNPNEPDAKIKFLAAEALRGVGGLIFDANGKRIANELGRRDYVTGEMWKNKPPFRLCLNKAAQQEILWHCKHYTGRGVMKFYQSGADLAKEMGVPLQTLVDSHEAHYQAAMKQKDSPDGGPYPAYPNGKSWDEASGKTGSGKKFFHNIIPGSAVAAEPFYVAIITPVIHYCMGGLEIDVHSRVLGAGNKPIPGLYAAGEIAGGVHGNNRLGGNSLLDCVVFGRVSGKHCTEYMNGKLVPKSLDAISGGGLSGDVAGSKLAGGSYEDNMNQKAAPSGGGGGGGLTLEEVAKHKTKNDCWVVVNGKVLDVTEFLKDHPGGELAIITFAGKDASEEFNMIHPPDVVGKYLPANKVLGDVGAGGGGGGEATAAPAPAAVVEKGDAIANLQAWGDWREGIYDNPGVLLIPFAQYLMAGWEMGKAILFEVCRTIFTVKNFKAGNDRAGLSRSAIFLIVFQVIHAIGNLHVFLGPDDFNGYGYFYVRLYWSGFGIPANIVEIYVGLAAMLHIFAGLQRTWHNQLNQPPKWGVDGNLNLAITGVLLMTFMIIHLFQFRLGATQPYLVRPPRYMINFEGIIHLNLFWTTDPTVTPVPVRDIYKLEFDLFRSAGWVAFYMFSVCVFMLHAMLGWGKLSAFVLRVPKGHIGRTKVIGWILIGFIGLIYLSFPLYTHFTAMKTGNLGSIG